MTRYFALFHQSTVDDFWRPDSDLPECMHLVAVHPHVNPRFRLVEVEDALAPQELHGQRVNLRFTKHWDRHRMTVRYERKA